MTRRLSLFVSERIEATFDQIGSPVRLARVLKEAIQGYFGQAASALQKQIPTARSDGKYTLTSDELTAMIVPALQGFITVRDAALTRQPNARG